MKLEIKAKNIGQSVVAETIGVVNGPGASSAASPAPAHATPLVDHEEILRLHAAAIECGLASRRDALLSGIDRWLVGTIPESVDALSGLLNDLTTLNAIGRPPGGDAPLLTWARNAAALTPLRVEGEVFKGLLLRFGLA